MENLNLEATHLSELDILKNMNEITQKFGLHYTLAFGSVLGAIRHNGFIPWDSDVDTLVDIDQYENFCKIMKENLPGEYKVFSNKDADYPHLFSRIGVKDKTDHEIHIDLFPIGGAPNNKFLRNKIWPFLRRIVCNIYYWRTVKIKEVLTGGPIKLIIASIICFLCKLIPRKLLILIYKYLFTKYPISTSELLTVGYFTQKKEWYYDTIRYKFENLYLPIPRDWDEYLICIYGKDYMIPKKQNYYVYEDNANY